jgi:tetratricopeptide (TPR) repeat protein
MHFRVRGLDMSYEQLFLLTSAAFRISMVAAGFFTAFLGYKLLLRGGGSEDSVSTDAVAKFGKIRVSATRLAPGSVFALFGMTLLGWMVHDGSPEYQSSTSSAGTSVHLRGEGGEIGDAVSGEFILANRLMGAGRQPEALHAYQKYMSSIAISANNMATLLVDRSRFDEAITLSRLAVALSPEKQEFLDTLVGALARSGQKEEARRVLKRAIDLAPESERSALAVLEHSIQ